MRFIVTSPRGLYRLLLLAIRPSFRVFPRVLRGTEEDVLRMADALQYEPDAVSKEARI